ncbi:MAG: hypothetical protein HY909_24725 [Deltaproteobacteria bacterium]|nr:hypothetical protein [Deltaproteobacteria bacterium]
MAIRADRCEVLDWIDMVPTANLTERNPVVDLDEVLRDRPVQAAEENAAHRTAIAVVLDAAPTGDGIALVCVDNYAPNSAFGKCVLVNGLARRWQRAGKARSLGPPPFKRGGDLRWNANARRLAGPRFRSKLVRPATQFGARDWRRRDDAVELKIDTPPRTYT